MRRTVLKEAARRFPWLANATLYGCMFASGDLVHQLLAKNEQMDWKHTKNVAIVGFCFQGHFNYFWLRALEQRFPGKSAQTLFKKLLLDQSFASPLATSVFYTGVSYLEGKEMFLKIGGKNLSTPGRLDSCFGHSCSSSTLP
ncbi:hypothetical protein WMY93_007880 [Mugilogobius chulae]|uniref:Mpv17-like protein n=1 Tax=Mugilogobius chulae TaxID=88201 RepID=A0AAW0PHX1_9GOBI